MSEREKQIVNDLMDIVDQLPETQQHRLLGVAEGMSMASSVENATEQVPKTGQ